MEGNRNAGRERRSWILVGLGLLCTACQSAYFGLVNVGTETQYIGPRDGIVFDVGAGLGLDVHRPQRATTAAPLVVFFYGGAWQRGTRQSYRFAASALAERGIVVVVPDYRLYPSARFPGFVEDGARAVAWSLDHAAQLGIDPKRVYVAGHSAGAHIAALLGSDARYLEAVGHHPRELAGVIGIAGPYDFTPMTNPLLLQIFGDETRQRQSQPIHFVDGDEPPFLLLHGTSDGVVEARNSETLARRLEAAGREVKLVRYRGVGHIRIITALRYPSLAPTLEDIVGFVAPGGGSRVVAAPAED